MNDISFHEGIRLFIRLSVLHKCPVISDYSYRLDPCTLDQLLQGFIREINRHNSYRSDTINLYGDESVLQTHWIPTKRKRLKGALTLFAQYCQSTLFQYGQADVLRTEVLEQIIALVKFWKKAHRKPIFMLIFDLKLASYGLIRTPFFRL